jgi:hypothetical protein
MCVNEVMCEVVDSLQRRNSRKTETLTRPRGESRERSKKGSRSTYYNAEKGNRKKRVESVLNATALAKKEEIIFNRVQDPREPWYFVHI